ncbi:PH domain-containing protein [Lachnospiraceae bacterium 54-53]
MIYYDSFVTAKNVKYWVRRKIIIIDFENGTFVKLKKADRSGAEDVTDLLNLGEVLISCYKGMKDYVVFTNKRIICVSDQGLTGRKKSYMSMPYSKIEAFSFVISEDAGMDSELEIYFHSLGKVKFEFTGTSNIVEIGKFIGSNVL